MGNYWSASSAAEDPRPWERLVQRHGPMVWGVCRRLVGNHHDAEDAFQATFLVLVHKAGSVRQREMVGNWLYGVAYRTARKARARRGEAAERERRVRQMPEPAPTEQDALERFATGPRPGGELACRTSTGAVIVLCELEGKTGKEAARQLGLPGRHVGRAAGESEERCWPSGWLGNGVALSGGALAAVLSQKTASAAVPSSVMASTIKVMALVAAGKSGVISGTVAALTDGVLKAMLLNKIMKVAAVLVVLAMGLVGAGLLSNGTAAEQPNEAIGEQLQEVLVRHPKQTEATPTEQFTGRLGNRQGDSIAVTFAVDERSYLRYQRLLQKQQVKGPGSPLSLGLADDAEFPHQGTLKGFDDRIDPETGTVQARATLPNPDRLLLPGMFVRVRMPFGPAQKVLEIPDNAILADQGKHYVLVVTGEDIVERRAVSLGAAEGTMRIIEKGVGTDDWVVVGLVGGLENLKPGIHIKRRIVDDAPQKGADEPQQQDVQRKDGVKEHRKRNADPDDGPADQVAKKLWAGMSVNQPLFRVGQTTNLIQFSFALVNESDKVVDPKITGYPRLIVNGKELYFSSIPGVGPRERLLSIACRFP